MANHRQVWAPVLLAFLALGPAWAGNNVWTRIGPDGGQATTIAIDPQNSGTLYVGTGKGLFKTTDGGGTWIQLNDGPRLAPTSASIDTQNPATMYAAIRDHGPTGAWVFKSTDGGITWTQSNTGLQTNEFVGYMTVDPQTPSTVYFIGTASNLCPQPGSCAGNQVFKSIDGAATWSPVSGGLPSDALITCLAIDPQNPHVLYAARYGGAIFKTADGGGSWTSISSATGVWSLAVDPQNHNTIYALTSTSLSSGLLKSMDGGAQWSPVSSSVPWLASTAPLGFYPGNVSALLVDPGNSNILYVVGRDPMKDTASGPAGYTVFKSVDGGNSWAATAFGSGWGGSPTMVALDSKNAGTIYAAASSGVFKSTDGGGSWTPRNSGLGGSVTGAFALDPRNAGTIYAETSLGLVKTTNGGTTWRPLGDGLAKALQCTGSCPALNLTSLVIDPQNSGTLYTGSDGKLPGGILRSIDAGASWATAGDASWTASLQSSGNLYFQWKGGLAVDPQTAGTLYAFDVVAGNGSPLSPFTFYLFKSSDGGDNWARVSDNFIDTLTVDPHDSSTLYASDNSSGSKSTDGGVTWNRLPSMDPPADNFPQDCDDFWNPSPTFAVDPQNPKTVYATKTYGVFKSTDGGASWNSLDSALSAYTCVDFLVCGESYDARSLVIDPQDTKTLYVIFGGRVLVSRDGGTSWNPIGSGLPDKPLQKPFGSTAHSDLALDPNDRHTLYLATVDDGIYTITLGP